MTIKAKFTKKQDLAFMQANIEPIVSKLMAGSVNGEKMNIPLAITLCNDVCDKVAVGLNKSDLKKLEICRKGLIEEINNYEFVSR